MKKILALLLASALSICQPSMNAGIKDYCTRKNMAICATAAVTIGAVICYTFYLHKKINNLENRILDLQENGGDLIKVNYLPGYKISLNNLLATLAPTEPEPSELELPESRGPRSPLPTDWTTGQ